MNNYMRMVGKTNNFSPRTFCIHDV